jgi:hypothetical protein
VRSRRLTAGQQTHLETTFYTRIDGPGRHGEVVAINSNDDRATRRAARYPLASEIAFFITTKPQ